MGRGESWQRKWIVFDDGVLTCSESKAGLSGDSAYADSEGGEDSRVGVMRIPMDQVISLRTDVSRNT